MRKLIGALALMFAAAVCLAVPYGYNKTIVSGGKAISHIVGDLYLFTDLTSSTANFSVVGGSVTCQQIMFPDGTSFTTATPVITDHAALTSTGTLTHAQIESSLNSKLGMTGSSLDLSNNSIIGVSSISFTGGNIKWQASGDRLVLVGYDGTELYSQVSRYMGSPTHQGVFDTQVEFKKMVEFTGTTAFSEPVAVAGHPMCFRTGTNVITSTITESGIETADLKVSGNITFADGTIINSSATLGGTAASVAWEDITGKPAGFADDVDNTAEGSAMDHTELTSTGTITHAAIETAISNIGISTGTIAANLLTVQQSTITIGSAETQAASGTHTHTGTYAPTTHNHAGTDINSGTVGIDYLPTGTGATNVALGNHAHTGTYAAYSIGVDTGTLRTDLNAVQASTVTIGTGATNAAAGNHAHSGVYQPVGDYAVNADTLTIGTGATNAAAGNHNHTGTYIGAAGVTYEQLDSNGDVGTSAGQLAIGNHTHSYQASDADLTAIAGLSSADGNFIVGSATGWVAENGATALASIGAAAASHTQAASSITDAVVDLQSVKVGSSTIALGVAAANVKDGSLGASVIASSVAINAVRKESIKDLNRDGVYIILGATTTAGTNAIPISEFFESAVTISTVTAWCSGGTSLAFNIEERTSPDTAGTDIWSSDVTATGAHTGGTLSNASIASGAQLYLVPTTWTGAVNKIIIKLRLTRD